MRHPFEYYITLITSIKKWCVSNLQKIKKFLCISNCLLKN
ncbi:hypothetical protein SLEP1_g31626 [Rubroshorea leprosula]|uniref:Uncharacterized protein n=1 Tax=Rubroshorea leprosula TaxID=152421 RepID=A0AAV5K3X6_9ROSI|nr:hypothetical protein SLEP1_g31626 [Rubroshorea leprosula]